ncbi:MAG: DUF177 domain-containing protein [Balneola sp.]|nr:MAG: DUF177 domain-containing protein [Balneola sp.]
MFKFKIFEIPEGKSERSIQLNAEDIDLGEVSLKSGTININFYRTTHFIQVQMALDVTVTLICDRSLDAYPHLVETEYQVIFKNERVEESIDERTAIRNIDHASKQINIEQDVLDTILVNVPTKKLHPRLLDEQGNPKEMLSQTFGESSDENDEDYVDPRWEALKALKK